MMSAKVVSAMALPLENMPPPGRDPATAARAGRQATFCAATVTADEEDAVTM